MKRIKVIEGNKIFLGVLKKEDVEKIWLTYDFETKRFMGNTVWPELPEEKEKLIQPIAANRGRVAFGIFHKENEELLGVILLVNLRFPEASGEIVYWLSREARRKGYGSETVGLMLDYAFNFLNLRKVYAKVKEPNEISRRILEKYGFKLMGKLRQHDYIPYIGFVDLLYFDLFKEEWESLKKNQ